jgi:predicted DNA binding protein
MRANQLDAYQKGRKIQPRSRHANAKLTPKQVREIRRSYDAGEKIQVVLAAEFGVSQRAISLVVRRETYTDIT